MKKQYSAGSIKHLVRQVACLERLKDKKEYFFEALTDREVEILSLVAGGMSSTAIAEELQISSVTVQNHRAHIRSKLNLHSQVGYVKYALAYDLISF